MNKFEQYLKQFADHEDEKSKPLLRDPRARILVNAGIRLNWHGDFFANSEIKWQELELPIEKVQLAGTSLEWNKILIDRCKRSAVKFKELIRKHPEIREKFTREASFGDELILVRESEDKGFYKVLDGMHRFVGALLRDKEKIKVWFSINGKEHLPICESHVVYDLIRAYIRNAKDEQGKAELYHALKLLSRTYANVKDLLCNRFNENYVHDDEVQNIIKKVLKKN